MAIKSADMITTDSDVAKGCTTPFHSLFYIRINALNQ